MGRTVLSISKSGETKEYDTITLLRKATGLKSPTINRSLKTGRPIDRGEYRGWSFRYSDDKRPIVPVKVEWTETFIDECNAIHNNKFDYSLSKLKRATDKIDIICPEHGVFSQKPIKHKTGQGCPNCRAGRISKTKRAAISDFEVRARNIHGLRYGYGSVEYVNNHTNITIECKEHGDFEQTPNNHIAGKGCSKCTNLYSKGEIELAEFIHEQGVEFKQNDRSVISPFEIDILIEGHSLAIEYNGAYWHSAHANTRHQHQDKQKMANNAGYRLIQVFEIDWINKKDIVKSIIKNALGKTENKISGRKTEKRKITTDEYKEFMKSNHIKGYRTATDKIGLFYEKELVSVTGVTKGELIRFASKLNTLVHGALNKLTSEYKELHTYCDLSYFDGTGYKKGGFIELGRTQPGFCYVRNHKVMARQFFQKHKLKEVFGEDIDMNLTEEQICNNNNWHRYYDAGSLKLVINR